MTTAHVQWVSFPPPVPLPVKMSAPMEVVSECRRDHVFWSMPVNLHGFVPCVAWSLVLFIMQCSDQYDSTEQGLINLYSSHKSTWPTFDKSFVHSSVFRLPSLSVLAVRIHELMLFKLDYKQVGQGYTFFYDLLTRSSWVLGHWCLQSSSSSSIFFCLGLGLEI